jgi:hypothetical protein
VSLEPSEPANGKSAANGRDPSIPATQGPAAIVHASPNGHRLEPELSGVVDMQDFDGLVFDTVCRNIG